MGQTLSILDADSCSGKQFLELHGIVSTSLLGRLVSGEDNDHAVINFMRHVSVIPNRADIDSGLITLLLHVGPTRRPVGEGEVALAEKNIARERRIASEGVVFDQIEKICLEARIAGPILGGVHGRKHLIDYGLNHAR
eukprot:scaffold951_cov118-Isochrysis_galbana.AAC.2